MMQVVSKLGDESVAVVYVLETQNGMRVECVESLEPPIPRSEKWVHIISTLFGCPVSCPYCDAGLSYTGKLTAEQMMFQIDTMVVRRFPDRIIPSKKWKVQFARMGEPSFNPAVLSVLRSLPQVYNAPGLLPSLSTIAPKGTGRFFAELLSIKRQMFNNRFQLQFSIHSTDDAVRRMLVPAKTWSLREIAEYGGEFYHHGGRKITLNFALMENVPVNGDRLSNLFNPEFFLIKLTPLNPTLRALKNGLKSTFHHDVEREKVVSELSAAGFEVIVSLGELEENAIGSNCGQYVSTSFRSANLPAGVYAYPLVEVG